MRCSLFLWLVGLAGTALLDAACAGQIDLVYPRHTQDGSPYVFADTVKATFLFGNLSPATAKLEINAQKIGVTSDGAFLAYVPLDVFDGTKSFRIALIEDGKQIEVIDFPYLFAREKIASQKVEAEQSAYAFPMVLQVTAKNAATRTMPDGTYEFFPPLGTKLITVGLKERFFIVFLGAGAVTYISEQFVTPDSGSILEPAVLGNATVASMPERTLVRFPITSRRLFRSWLSDDLQELTVSFYQTAANTDKMTFEPRLGGVDLVRWRSAGANQVDISIRCVHAMEHGYSVSYAPDGTAAEVSIRHQPNGRRHSLDGKHIVVDPGHGGEASGAVGPLRTLEKDVVLCLAKLLEGELTRRGASVFLTRETDTTLGLYDRVDVARTHDADFLISLHANALPDGENPFLRHGSGTYYYHPGSRRAAEAVHRRLLKATGLRDDGIFYDDLALVRPTEFPAVLVEVAYMMVPEEEKLLRDEEFPRRVAKELAKGIQDYFRMR